jgi:ethanolamine utilization microcompartment shell protein EutS
MQAYKIMARNSRTKQRIVQQFLDGTEVRELALAEQQAREFAERMGRQGRDQWVGEVELYETR